MRAEYADPALGCLTRYNYLVHCLGVGPLGYRTHPFCWTQLVSPSSITLHLRECVLKLLPGSKALGFATWAYPQNFKDTPSMIEIAIAQVATGISGSQPDHFARLLEKNTSLVCTGGCLKSLYISSSPFSLLWNQCPWRPRLP
jgi:hypothetical protein